MAQLTPLSKGLIGLIVIGAMASATWHLKLKDRFGAAQNDTAPPAQTVSGSDTAVPASIAPPPAPAVEVPPEKLEQAIQAPPKAAPAANSPAPKPAHSKPAQASADPWAELNIDKKGNKP